MNNFFQWLWAVCRFIPAVIYVTVRFIGFYIFIKLSGEPLQDSDARDRHNYLDYFDK